MTINQKFIHELSPYFELIVEISGHSKNIPFFRLKMDDNLLPDLISMNKYTSTFLEKMLQICKKKDIDALTPIAYWLDEGQAFYSNMGWEKAYQVLSLLKKDLLEKSHSDNIITTFCNICVKATTSSQAINLQMIQLELAEYIQSKEDKIELFKNIYARILINNTLLNQKVIFNHWTKYHEDIKEIEHLVPALSKVSSTISMEAETLYSLKLDCNKLTFDLKSDSSSVVIYNMVNKYLEELIVYMPGIYKIKNAKDNNNFIETLSYSQKEMDMIKYYLDFLIQNNKKLSNDNKSYTVQSLLKDNLESLKLNFELSYSLKDKNEISKAKKL